MKWLDVAEDAAREAGNVRDLIGIHYRRARNLIATGQYLESESHLLEAISGSLNWGEHRFVAEDKYWLAIVYMHTDRVFLARQIAQEALMTFKRLGMAHKINNVERLLASL